MEWDKIWAINRKVIDPIAPRYTALQKNEKVLVNIAGVSERCQEAVLNPKVGLQHSSTWIKCYSFPCKRLMARTWFKQSAIHCNLFASWKIRGIAIDHGVFSLLEC